MVFSNLSLQLHRASITARLIFQLALLHLLGFIEQDARMNSNFELQVCFFAQFTYSHIFTVVFNAFAQFFKSEYHHQTLCIDIALFTCFCASSSTPFFHYMHYQGLKTGTFGRNGLKLGFHYELTQDNFEIIPV